MGLEMYYTTMFTVKRKIAADGAWGQEGTEQVSATVLGWLQPIGGKPMMQDGKQVAISTHLLLCPISVDVKVMDLLEIGNAVYRVLSVNDAAGMGHHLEIDLEVTA